MTDLSSVPRRLGLGEVRGGADIARLLLEGRAFFATYAAAKAAQRAFWTAWAVETRKTALRAPLVLPPPMPKFLKIHALLFFSWFIIL